jgi:hypothetical protein
MGLHERFGNERAWRKRPDSFPEGKDIERAAFGIPPIKNKDRLDTYQPFNEALQYVHEHQPSPLERRSHSIKNLRSKIASLCHNEFEPVKFYTAVDTPLDTYHGVDGFFEQGHRIVTVDISMREKEAFKADVLLIASLDEDGRVVIDEREMDRVAHEVADRLNQGHMRRAA